MDLTCLFLCGMSREEPKMDLLLIAHSTFSYSQTTISSYIGMSYFQVCYKAEFNNQQYHQCLGICCLHLHLLICTKVCLALNLFYAKSIQNWVGHSFPYDRLLLPILVFTWVIFWPVHRHFPSRHKIYIGFSWVHFMCLNFKTDVQQFWNPVIFQTVLSRRVWTQKSSLTEFDYWLHKQVLSWWYWNTLIHGDFLRSNPFLLKEVMKFLSFGPVTELDLYLIVWAIKMESF